MKKKILKLLVCCIVFFLILILGIYISLRIKEKKIIEGNIQILPSFCAVSIINNREFCTGLLPNNPIVIMFIHPECDFCQEEIKQLRVNQNNLKDIFILLITSSPKEQARDFYINQELSQFTNLQFLSDEDMKISDCFDVNIIPSIFLYNENQKLIHKFKGEIKVETLIRYLSE